jgi:hypothetical protein
MSPCKPRASLPDFEVSDLKGRHYKIWADGHIEGFDDLEPRVVVNRIPRLVADGKRSTRPVSNDPSVVEFWKGVHAG